MQPFLGSSPAPAVIRQVSHRFFIAAESGQACVAGVASLAQRSLPKGEVAAWKNRRDRQSRAG